MKPIIALIVFAAVSLLFCCIGFKRFVWFMSVGYGLSSAGLGLAALVLSLATGRFPVFYLIQCVLFMIYGIRLGGFLLMRELKNAGYKSKLQEIGANADPPVFVAAVMWIFCGLLYVCQSAGLVFRFTNALPGEPIVQNVSLYVGIAVSAVGIVIEALADKQKSEQKKQNPGLPAMTGLYKISRCPNYFGEILFWTGSFVTLCGTACNWWQWVIGIIGYIAIVGIMFSGAKRLETRHIKNYGSIPEYNAYADKTPILIPLIPVYHVVTPESIAAAEAKKAAKKAVK